MKRIATYIWQHSLIALLSASTLITPACTAQQKLAVVQDIQKFIPVVTDVADAVCAFTPAAAICAGATTAVEASANTLATALTNYYSAEAKGTVPAGTTSALSLAISTFENDASAIFNAIHIDNTKTQGDIMSMAASAQALLAVIETQFPSSAAATANLKFAASRPSSKSFSLNSFAASYNSQVDKVNSDLPRGTKTLAKVHAHSLLLRVLPGIH